MIRGACLCGAVRLRIEGPLPDPWACHCGQCRKQTGHHLASIEVPRACVAFEGLDAIGRYRASERAERGFCQTCGSTLYWRLDGCETIWIAMGLLDDIEGLHLTRHVHLADKGDYYDIPQTLGVGA
ncbi:GFA family protein [uncultured Roseovarius sp.]|uniref:GFA family protein n=1 Tax=uncultured Roseovarius sp. TaxID=293344 RepID=UPI0025DEC3F1|nr:GFA family protein [uncultured Roseovarius sp.]